NPVHVRRFKEREPRVVALFTLNDAHRVPALIVGDHDQNVWSIRRSSKRRRQGEYDRQHDPLHRRRSCQRVPIIESEPSTLRHVARIEPAPEATQANTGTAGSSSCFACAALVSSVSVSLTDQRPSSGAMNSQWGTTTVLWWTASKPDSLWLIVSTGQVQKPAGSVISTLASRPSHSSTSPSRSVSRKSSRS